ncbi:hypothetical protein IMZ48_46430 [Candidatus Bathyarchaeota archaeon]|nr:hypothetical protein [Candidatus Bathyarchaeota archaeon]
MIIPTSADFIAIIANFDNDLEELSARAKQDQAEKALAILALTESFLREVETASIN